jgi:hypothetical protein
MMPVVPVDVPVVEPVVPVLVPVEEPVIPVDVPVVLPVVAPAGHVAGNCAPRLPPPGPGRVAVI